MFIWNDYYHFEFKDVFGCLALIARPQGARPFAMPPLGGGDRLLALDFLFKELEEPVMSRVPEEFAQEIAEKRPDFKIVPDPDNDDYVYLSEKLITLSGRRMHQKKNHYNYFKQNYRHEYVDATPAITPELIAVEDLWLEAKTEKDGSGTHLIKERNSVHLALSHMEELGLTGLAVRVEGKIEAFTLGEPLSEDTAVIHVEKGNPEIRGVYEAMRGEFCKRRFSHLTFVNREQDLGLPGLRFSKESLKPFKMARKFVVTP
jgi:hypothetical protein